MFTVIFSLFSELSGLVQGIIRLIKRRKHSLLSQTLSDKVIGKVTFSGFGCIVGSNVIVTVLTLEDSVFSVNRLSSLLGLGLHGSTGSISGVVHRIFLMNFRPTVFLAITDVIFIGVIVTSQGTRFLFNRSVGTGFREVHFRISQRVTHANFYIITVLLNDDEHYFSSNHSIIK